MDADNKVEILRYLMEAVFSVSEDDAWGWFHKCGYVWITSCSSLGLAEYEIYFGSREVVNYIRSQRKAFLAIACSSLHSSIAEEIR